MPKAELVHNTDEPTRNVVHATFWSSPPVRPGQAAGPISSPSRRGMLAAAASALVAGAAVATTAHAAPIAEPSDDAKLIQLADEIIALDAESQRLGEIQDDLPVFGRARDDFNKKHIRPLVDRHHDLMPQLAMTPATTMPGFLAKARVIQTISNCAPGYADPWQDDAMGWSLANDLLGVASVWRTDEERALLDEDFASMTAAREAEQEAEMAEIKRRTNVETMTRAELEASVPGILEFRDTADRLYRRTIERLGGDVA
jgi:hypothetical protein